MSFIVQPQTLLASIFGPGRQFGATNQIFKGYVTINENSIDSIEITQQPVQQGASIGDHAFKKPNTLSLTLLFSPTLTTSLSTIYQNLLNLENSFTLVTVTTPKRTYLNMLITAVGVTTDKHSENTMSVNVSFQNIVIVPLQVGNIPSSQLKNAGSNQATQNVGSKQSILSGIASTLGFK